MAKEIVDKQALFGDLDFQTLGTNPDFKEDSVREVIILPILKELGYQQNSIIRSKTLTHPFIKIGSKKRKITLVPDYCLTIEDNIAWVLDAKSPEENIIDSDHIEQVYSYASHPEVRSAYFALCNGLEFFVYRRESTNIPVLQFYVDQIEHSWDKLYVLLSPSSFHV